MSRYLVNLKKGADELVPKVIASIDTTNVLATQVWDYTATQDCVYCATAINIVGVSINSVVIFGTYSSGGYNNKFIFYLKEGDNIVFQHQDYGSDSKVFGLKF